MVIGVDVLSSWTGAVVAMGIPRLVTTHIVASIRELGVVMSIVHSLWNWEGVACCHGICSGWVTLLVDVVRV